jgi:tetratricopeptide (TPR) repeat protein
VTVRTKIGVLVLVCLFVGVAGWAREAPKGDVPVAPLHEGLGSAHLSITTSSEVAQTYFDQGLRLGYGFWWPEARRSMEEAVRQDPDSPMVYWGKAWAWGPYVNNGNPPERDLETAYEAIQEALKRKSNGTPFEQAMIDALATRYDKDPEAEREPFDQAYYEAMKNVAGLYPESPEALTLAAAAFMNTTRWDYWDKEGKPKAGTPWLVETLESSLELDGEHSGSIHYYIHAVEASDDPYRARPYARILASTAPGIAHLVHMGSHILIQTGDYDQAADTNINAAVVDEFYISQPDQEGRYQLGSYHHNVHFIWSAATFEGRSAVSLQYARKLREKIYLQRTRDDIQKSWFTQLYASLPYFAMVRFGKWDDMLGTPSPEEEILFEKAMWHYGRGIAFLGKNDIASATTEQEAVRAIADGGEVKGGGRLSVDDMLDLAATTLQGEIAAKRGDYDKAIALLEESVKLQDGLSYTEPPPWHYPTRQSLGAVYLDAGKPAEAEAVYRADLKNWTENGWSLYGLMMSLREQGKSRQADLVEKRFLKAWVRADVALNASRF